MKSKALVVVVCLCVVGCLFLVLYCRSDGIPSYRSATYDPMLLDLSTERAKFYSDQVDPIVLAIDRGEPPDADALRLLIHYFNEPGVESFAAIAIGGWAEADPQSLGVVLALLEDKCVRAPAMSKAVWLNMLASTLDLPTINLEYRQEALRNVWAYDLFFWSGEDRLVVGRLGKRARAAIASALRSDDFERKISFLDPIIYAYMFGGEDARWVVGLLDEQLATATGAERRFWLAAKGSITGRLVYPDKPQ